MKPCAMRRNSIVNNAAHTAHPMSGKSAVAVKECLF